MFLYHGSNIIVNEPRIIESVRARDFGSAFYTTSSRAQALRWASLQEKRRRTGIAQISIYDFDIQVASHNLKIKIYEYPNKEWLDFVVDNRKSKYEGLTYDLVIGPVANDRTMTVINDYIMGNISEETALILLMPQKLEDQYAFLSQEALSNLTFVEGVRCDE